MTRCARCEIWKNNSNPYTHDQICGCKCHQAQPLQLLDLSTPVEVENANNTKSAVQVFMEGKVEQFNAKEKLKTKLALLEQEVKLGLQLLEQTRTLKKSKEALLLKKVRVNFNKCHKFWRGEVIGAHKSFVDEQVAAAKARLGLRRLHNQFDISAMVKKIDELAPDARYASANPLPSSTSTSRPWVWKPRRPRSVLCMVPLPPVSISKHAKKSSPLPAAVLQTSLGYRGDQSIVCHGDTFAEEFVYDHSTQLEPEADGYLWDGEYDFSYYENEVEVDFSDFNVIGDDCYYDDEVATSFDAKEEEIGYHDAEVEECNYYCFAEDCYDC